VREAWSLQIVSGWPRSFNTPSRRWSQAPTHASAPFTYAISAAYSGKHDPLNLTANLYTHDPHRQSTTTITESHWSQRKSLRPQSGQDAFFVSNVGFPSSSHSNNNGCEQITFGVADGVGGWADSGVDAADFAHALCDNMASASIHYPDSFGGSANAPHPLRPTDLLEHGYQSVLQDRRILAGGSTACIAVAGSDATLEVANLGDSGYAHLSPFRLNSVSQPQTHAFNTPFQLSKIPPKLVAQAALFGGHHYADYPTDAHLTRCELAHGDVLVFATDGVWDNLSPEDILRTTCRVMIGMGGWLLRPCSGAVEVSPGFASLAKRLPSSSTSVLEEAEEFGDKVRDLSAVLASAVTREAKEASLSQKRDGPFAREMQKLYPEENWRGGKADDICTLVVLVMQEGL
jgi:protein phosphatase PTC7